MYPLFLLESSLGKHTSQIDQEEEEERIEDSWVQVRKDVRTCYVRSSGNLFIFVIIIKEMQK